MEQNFEHLLAINADDVFVLTGDLNHLNTSRFESILSFVQIINTPTHNNNIIDKFITLSVHVMQSLVKTKHKAVRVNCDKPADSNRSVQPWHMIEVHFYSPTVANLLCQALSSYNWNTIINAIDNKSNTLDAIYADLLKLSSDTLT